MIVPVVEFGDDPADQGPFPVSAAGLRIENVRASGDASPGPPEAIEAFSLSGKAYRDSPRED